MWKAIAGLSMIVLLGPASSRAACSNEVLVTSSSEVCLVGGCTSAFDIGNPAVSQKSDSLQLEVDPSYNFATSATLTIDNGFFAATTHVSGSTDIEPFASYGAGARVLGNINDCFAFGGYQGSGVAHVPIRLEGGVDMGWLINGAYMLPPNLDPAEIQFQLICQFNFFQQVFNTLMPVDSPPGKCFRLHISECY